jgi:curli biogenesis system outer membrane secretion channel CsgG
MKISIKLALSALGVAMLMTGCAQKVKIKALNPAEVGEMASKKKVAVSKFRNDKVGLSGKIESKIAKHKLDRKKYFTVLSRKDMNKVISEQKLQSSELMDEKTTTRIGKLIGAQAIINGEIASASAESGKYLQDKKECLRYYKKGGCAQWRFYKVTCRTTQATVAANLNIVNIETGSIIYGDTISKDYNGDTCKSSGGLFSFSSNKVLSKRQAINMLTDQIANEFVKKITPHYIFVHVTIIDDIDVSVTGAQKDQFKNALAYIKAGRMDKADRMLSSLMDETNGRSVAVAYNNGVVKEAQGKLEDAKKLYRLADDLTTKPVEEVNLAVVRIDKLIEKRARAQKQMSTK